MGSTTVFLSERLLGGSGRAEGVRRGQRKRLPVSRDGFVRSDTCNDEDGDADGDDDGYDQNYSGDDDDDDLSPAEKRRKDNKGDAVRVRGTKKPAPSALKTSKADFLSDHTGSLMRKWKLADSQGALNESIEKYNSKKMTKCKRSIIVSLIQGFTRVSVDRVGPHNCAHELEHVELCIRLLNSQAGMTREKFCHLMIHQTKVKLAEDVLIAYKKELAALEKGDPLPVPEWLQARDDDDDDDDVEDFHPQEEEEEEVDNEVDEEEEDDEDGDEVHEHLEDDDDSQAHSSADSDDSDDESYLPGDDEEEEDIDDVIDLVVEDDDVLAGYVEPQNIFTRLYNEVLQGWATVTTNWMSLWQRMAGHFLVEAPVMMEEEEVIINDDVVIPILDGGNEGIVQSVL
jgi:hypothetical protein